MLCSSRRRTPRACGWCPRRCGRPRAKRRKPRRRTLFGDDPMATKKPRQHDKRMAVVTAVWEVSARPTVPRRVGESACHCGGDVIAADGQRRETVNATRSRHSSDHSPGHCKSPRARIGFAPTRRATRVGVASVAGGTSARWGTFTPSRSSAAYVASVARASRAAFHAEGSIDGTSASVSPSRVRRGRMSPRYSSGFTPASSQLARTE